MTQRPGILVGRAVTVKDGIPVPNYYTAVHRKWLGRIGRIHAVVPQPGARANPLIKVGFDDGQHIVFYRLSELHVHSDEALGGPVKHGKRGSHLPPKR